MRVGGSEAHRPRGELAFIHGRRLQQLHMPMAGAFPKFAATGAGVYFAVFLAGAVGHLLLEAAGLNKKFCEHAYD